MSQVTMLFDGNRMVTFDPNQTVHDLLSSPIVQGSIGKCVLSTVAPGVPTEDVPSSTNVSTDGVLANDLYLFDAFTLYKPQFVCGAEVYTPLKFIPTKDRITEDQLNYLRKEYYRIRNDSTKDYPMEQIQMMYLNMDSAIGWVTAFLSNHWGPMRSFPDYVANYSTVDPLTKQDLGVYSFTGSVLSIDDSRKLALAGQTASSTMKRGEPTRIAITGDWASGTIEADYVGQLIKQQDPHYTINIGDIYLVGTPRECDNHVLGIRHADDKFKYPVKWPIGSRGAFWFQGNHEMHSRGFGYFDSVLPAMGLVDQTSGKVSGQKASYVVLESEYFRVIGLDTGYSSYSVLYETHSNPQPPTVMDWLIHVVRINDPADTRALVILTHHNTVSAFQGAYDATPQQINKLLYQEKVNREVIWIFGHEHKTALYERQEILPGSSILQHPRMVGSGGFGVDCFPIPPRAREAGLLAYDSRVYRTLTSDWGSAPISYNGWSVLTFVDDELTIDYYTLQLAKDSDVKPDNQKATHIISEKFIADKKGSALWIEDEFKIIDPNITVITHSTTGEGKTYRRNTSQHSSSEALAQAGFDMKQYQALLEQNNPQLYNQINSHHVKDVMYNTKPLKQVTDEEYAVNLILEYVQDELNKAYPEKNPNFDQIKSITVHPNHAKVNTTFKGVIMPRIQQIILKD